VCLTDQTEKKFSHAAVHRFLSEKRLSSATSKSIFEYYKIGKGTTCMLNITVKPTLKKSSSLYKQFKPDNTCSPSVFSDFIVKLPVFNMYLSTHSVVFTEECVL
jgi:hypothetical protein